jgi:hypothetical protein
MLELKLFINAQTTRLVYFLFVSLTLNN